MSTLEKLEPQIPFIKIKGKDVKIFKPKVGKISKILKHVSPIIEAIIGSFTKKTTELGLVSDLVKLIEQNSENMIEVVLCLTDADKEFVEDLELAEFITLAVEVIFENKSFFSQGVSLLPEATQKKAKEMFGGLSTKS